VTDCASELVGLRRDAFNLRLARLDVSRLKGSEPSTQPLQADTIQALRKLFAENPDKVFAFVNERGEPFARAGFQRVVERAGRKAGFAFGVHPHMLRHACGYKLANDGEDTRDPRLLGTQEHQPWLALHISGIWIEDAEGRRVALSRRRDNGQTSRQFLDSWRLQKTDSAAPAEDVAADRTIKRSARRSSIPDASRNRQT
jgi:hypothetical protein